MRINKKICIIGRNGSGIDNNFGLQSTTYLLQEQITKMNIGITQVVNFFEIKNNVDIIKNFDIIFIDDFISESKSNLELEDYFLKLKTTTNKIVYINHVNWTNKTLFDISDKVLQLKKELLIKKMNNDGFGEYIKNVVEYNFQVPDYFQCVNEINRRKDKLIFVGTINESKLPFDFIDFLLNTDEINIDFYGKIQENTSDIFREKINSLFNMNNYNHFGQVQRELLPFILNNYKYFVLYSNTDITSIQSIEQLRCGCKPFIKRRVLNDIDILNYSNEIMPLDTPNDLKIKLNEYIHKGEYNPFEISENNKKFTMQEYYNQIMNIINELS